MIKIITKIGNSYGIIFTVKDMERYGMVLGDKIDMSKLFLVDSVSLKRSKKKNENK